MPGLTGIRVFLLAAAIGGAALLAAAPARASIEACDANVTDCPAPGAPEPATLSLLALGVAGLAIARRRK